MATTAESIEFQLRQDSRSSSFADDSSARNGSTLIARVIARLHRWQELSRQRRELAQLSDEILKDIGLSRVDALREARRPFWDDAGHRKQRGVSGYRM